VDPKEISVTKDQPTSFILEFINPFTDCYGDVKNYSIYMVKKKCVEGLVPLGLTDIKHPFSSGQFAKLENCNKTEKGEIYSVEPKLKNGCCVNNATYCAVIRGYTSDGLYKDVILKQIETGLLFNLVNICNLYRSSRGSHCFTDVNE